MLIALFLAFIILAIIRHFFKLRNLCPGPPSIPLLGALRFLFRASDPKEFIDKSLLRYGKVVRIVYGMLRFHVINDFSVAKDLFNRDTTAHRPVNWYLKEVKGYRGQVLGIIGTSGPLWTEQRRFALKNLRDFGFGRKGLDHVIQDEASQLVQSLLSESRNFSHEVLISNTFNAPIINVLWQIVASNRFEPGEKSTIEMMEKLSEQFKARMKVIDFIPFLRPYLPLPKTSRSVLEFKDMIRKEVENHEVDHDPNIPARDFIDVYLTEIKRSKESGDANFHKEQLVTVCLDFFQAGAETSSTTLTWFVMFMALNPDVQERCFQEIKQIIGNAPPRLDHMKELNYVHATMLEVQRMSATAPTSLIHATTEDIKVDDFIIPKKSLLMANLKLFLNDQKAFPNPELFNPSRFLDSGGLITKPEEFVPFGLGRRICMGDSLAKSEIFIFMVMILQKIKISVSKQDGPPDPSKYTIGITSIPDPFHVAMALRN
uniref:Cytochrome P450 CYP3041A2 n=1 Tax=Tigriopus japonicus TaxID=158387 RepID=A0A088DJT2_TIGJA|nr:cytochrome P450 CYP3041A2 [Tigriopus japonicus]